MNSNPDPVFDIKQQLDREVARRFDARSIRGLDPGEPHGSRVTQEGPLARIPVPIQWLGIAAAVVAAVTGLRSLYVDFVRDSDRATPVEIASALPEEPPPKPVIPEPAPIVERVVEPPRRRSTPVRESRSIPPTVGGTIAPALDTPMVSLESSTPSVDSVPRAAPSQVVATAPEPTKVVEPKSVQRNPATHAPASGVVASMAGSPAPVVFSSRGQTLPATVRDVPALGATIVSVIGAPILSGVEESPWKRSRPGPPVVRTSAPSSYYIRLLAGSNSRVPVSVRPTLVSTTLLTEAAGDFEELWGSQPHRAFLRSAFELGAVSALAGARTTAEGANHDAQAELVAVIGSDIFRLRFTAAPVGGEGAHRFEIELATDLSSRIQVIEGTLLVERNQIVVLALPDPRRVRSDGRIFPNGTTVFVVLSTRDESPDRRPLVEEDIEPPILIAGPQPRYSEEARWNRATGKVVLRATVFKNGTVGDPLVLEAPTGPGSQALIESAVSAVSEREYIPALRNQEPVEAYVTITIEFREDGTSIEGEPGE